MEFQKLFSHANELDWLHLVEDYIHEGGDINKTHSISGWALLHLAAEIQQYEAMRLLLKNGANPNLQDANGNTPLHLSVDSEIDASVQDGTDIDLTGTRLLLEAGADPNILNQQGLSPKDIARSYTAARQLMQSTGAES